MYKNRRSCVDIDECYEYGGGGCHHYCHNTLGNYYCLCEIGYYINDDGLSCSHGDSYTPLLYPEHIYPNDPYYQNPPQVSNIPYQRYPPVYPDHQIPLSQQPDHQFPYDGHQAPVYPGHIPLSQQVQPPEYPDHMDPSNETPLSQQEVPSNEILYGHQPPEYPAELPYTHPPSQQRYPEEVLNEILYGHQPPEYPAELPYTHPHSQQRYPEEVPYYQRYSDQEVPYYERYPDLDRYHYPYHSYLGDDPHFAVLLPSGVFLCYSVQGEHDKVFNLISNPDVHINALFIPDAKREEVTWIGSLGIVTHPRHSGRGNYRTYISFSTDNSSITVTHMFGGEDKQWRTVSLKPTHVSSISLSNGEMWVTHRTGNTKQPTVEVTLSDVKLNFTVKFVGSHLDMFWQEVGEQPKLSHGLIGQFYRQGVEIDGVRKMLIIPHKEPVPIMRKPIWSFMERDNDKEAEFCWTAMNSGFQGHGLIDGNYLNYKVSDLLSTDFSPANIHHRQHGRHRKV